MSKTNKMTPALRTGLSSIQRLFDLVAPIAIYHAADVCYERKAKRAIEKLFQHQDDPLVQQYLGHSAREEDWNAYVDYREPEHLKDVIRAYNDLFSEIVQEERPDWRSFIDRWGAYGFKDSRGQLVFAGDAMLEYPLYETAELLIERIHEHTEFSAEGT